MRRSETKESIRRRTRVRGSASVQYVSLVGVVGLAVAIALAARGKTMLVDYENARDLVLIPAQ